MYFVAVVADPTRHQEIEHRITRHFGNLAETGFAGGPAFHRVGDVLLAFDATSPFAEFSHDNLGFKLSGGYRSEASDGEPTGSWVTATLAESKLTLETDTYYPWPMYFGQQGKTLAAGNDVHAVAIALGLHELDDRAVVELAAMQFWILGRYTTVKGVDRVWPGERLVLPASAADLTHRVTPERVEQIRDYPSLAESQSFDAEAQAKQTFESLVGAIGGMKIDSANTVVGLSGGLDSRLTNLAISRAGLTDVHCFTISLEDGRELEIAGEITKRLGFEHEALELPKDEDSAVRNGWLLTGGQAPLNAAAGNLTSYRMHLQHRDPVRIVGAWPADLLIGAFVPSLADFTEPENLDLSIKWWLAQTTHRPDQYKLLKHSKFARKHLRTVRKTILKQTQESQAPTAAQRISRWAFAHCAPTFTFISPARLASQVQEVAPVMSRDFVKNLFGLRGEDLVERGFYQRMIYDAGPELRDIEYHNTGRLLSPEYMPLPQISAPIRLMLKLPLGVFIFAKALQERRAAKHLTPAPPLVQDLHWDRIYSEHLTKPLQLTDELTVDPASEPDVRLRVKFASSTLGCAWTREYLREFAGK